MEQTAAVAAFIALAVLCLVKVVLVLLGIFPFKKSVGHDLLGWHECTKGKTKGEVIVGRCSVCGKECILDDDGVWR